MSSQTPACGAVLGIDVGFSRRRRSSAVCRLDWTGDRISWRIERFKAVEPERTDTIVRVAGPARVLAAAFDGPLRRGFDLIGRYRTAESMLTRRLCDDIGKPGQASAPVGKSLNAAANACARVVLDRCDLAPAQHDVAIDGQAVVEAFPSSFLGLLIEEPAALNARRRDRSDIFFLHLAVTGGLERLIRHHLPGRRLVGELSTISNHDDRAAFVCALTALGVAAKDFTAVGDTDGHIILPPIQLIRPWALAALRANAAEIPGPPSFTASPAAV